MDQRDEFSKWMSTVEEALSGEMSPLSMGSAPVMGCDCGDWDCPTCFPEPNGLEMRGNEISPVTDLGSDEHICPQCGYSDDGHNHDNEEEFAIDINPSYDELDEISKGTLASYIPKAARSAADKASAAGYALGSDPSDNCIAGEDDDRKAFKRLKNIDRATNKLASIDFSLDEEDNDFIEKPKSGKGVKLGDIIHKTEFRKSGGQNSPLTYGEDNLDEDDIDNYTDQDYADDQQDFNGRMATPISDIGDNHPAAGMIDGILNMQDMGMSMDNREYSMNELQQLARDAKQISSVYDKVMGRVSENMPDIIDNSPSLETDPAITSINTPNFGESIASLLRRPTLFEQLKWDEQLDEELVDESSLSRLIGKQKGGANLVHWLHKKHKLSNDADLHPAPFSKRLLWKEYKRNPDNFVIVSAENGVAGIKPYEKHIKDRIAAAQKKGKSYDPGGDSTLPYQIIAFTDDGEQIDPSLLQPKPEDGETSDRYADPTVMKARMGLHTGREMQNPNNVFNLLADQIGRLRTIWVTGADSDGDEQIPFQKGAVERDKIDKRAGMKSTPDMDERDSAEQILRKVTPVLKTLANQALEQIHRSSQSQMQSGNYESAQKIAANGQKLKQFIAGMGDGNSREISNTITKSIEQASHAKQGSDEYKKWATDAARGNSTALKPILDALRNTLVSMS